MPMSKGERIVTNEGSHTGWELDGSWKVGMPWEGLKGEHFREWEQQVMVAWRSEQQVGGGGLLQQ